MQTARNATRKRSPLSEQVYAKLLDRIMRGAWEPGSFFDRRRAAKELGVSIAPVGEAMAKLEQEGFLINIPRKGTMLRPRDPRKLYENLMLREAIECQAAFMAFGSLGKMEKRLRQLAEEADGAKSSVQRAADAAFHAELVALAKVAPLSEEFERLSLLMLFDELSLLDPPERLIASHVRLLDELLVCKSPEEASAAVRRHLRAGRESLLSRFGN